MSLESDPILQKGPGFDFDYREPPLDQFLARFSSPLLYGLSTFSSCTQELNIHPITASILDDIRFLITTVLNLNSGPSDQEVKKLQSTAMWIHDRISSLPMDLLTQAEKAAGTKSSDAPKSEARPHSLLPHYPAYTASPSTPVPVDGAYTLPNARARGPKLAPLKPQPFLPPGPDHIYSVVRLAAPLYARAIGTRQPFSIGAYRPFSSLHR